jgi:pimeloyl-ACP methyl ester carboxylesterase
LGENHVPLAHARRLLDAFPHSTLIEIQIPDSSTFVMLDAPGQLAAATRSR